MADIRTTLSLILDDRITRPLKRVGKALDNVKQHQGMQRLSAASGDVSRNLNTMTGNAGRLAARMGMLTATVGGTVWGMERFVGTTTESAERVLELSNRLDVGVSWLDRWMKTGKRYGVSGEAIADGIKEMSLRLDEFVSTGKGESAEAWQRLFGSNARAQLQGHTDDLEGLFDMVRERVAGIEDASKRQRIIDEIFGGQGGEQLVELLSTSEGKINAIMKQINATGAVLDEQAVKDAREYNRQMTSFSETLAGLKQNVVLDLLPNLTSRLEELTKHFRNNREEIQGKVIGALETTWNVLTEIGGALKWTRDLLGGWGKVLGLVAAILGGPLIVSILGTAFAIGKLAYVALPQVVAVMPAVIGAVKSLSAALLTTPVGWIIAGIAAVAGAVYLIYRNWDAISGWFSQKFEAVKQAFDQGLIQGVLTLLREFNPVLFVMEAVNDIIKYFTGVDLAQVGADFIGGLWDGIKRQFFEGIRWLSQKVEEVRQWLPDWMGGDAGSPGGAGPGGGMAAMPGAQQQTARVGGALDVRITQDGRVQVDRMESEGMDMNVDTGPMMPGVR